MTGQRIRWSKLRWWLALAVVLAAVAGYYWTSGVTVLVGAVEKRTLTSEVEATGEVEPEDKVVLHSKLAGKIESVTVEAGDQVKKGQTLAQLDSRDLELEAEAAEARYQALSAQLAGAASAGRQQAQARLDETRAVFRVAELNHQRVLQLYQAEAVARSELDAAELELEQAQSAVKIAEQELGKLREHEGSQIKALQAQVDEARAQLDLVRENLQAATLTAPRDGTVLYRHIDPGQYIYPDTPLLVVGNPQTTVVKVYILQDDISAIKTGQPAQLSGETLGDKVMEGKIVHVAPAAEKIISSLGVEQTKFLTKVAPRQPELLRPGSKVDVTITTDRRENATVVPVAAVMESSRTSQVLTIKDGKAVSQEVVTGISDGEYIEIVKGLSPGEQIILEPGKIKPGQKVKKRT